MVHFPTTMLLGTSDPVLTITPSISLTRQSESPTVTLLAAHFQLFAHTNATLINAAQNGRTPDMVSFSAPLYREAA